MHQGQIVICALTSDKVDGTVVANMLNSPGYIAKTISKDTVEMAEMAGNQKGKG